MADHDRSDLEYFTTLHRNIDGERQLRFEQRVLLKLLRSFETRPGTAIKIKRDTEDHFNFVWFNSYFSDFPVKLAAYKCRKTVPFIHLLKWPEQTQIFEEFLENRDNFTPDVPTGVIFASDNDEMGDMVLHTAVNLGLSSARHWRAWPPMPISEAPGNVLLLDPIEGFTHIVQQSGWRLTYGED